MRFFETAGNAIVIAYDDRPVLTTDPWINADAYFGSWAHDYEISPRQIHAIRDAEYHWFSHGHPDHLNIASLPMLQIVFIGNSPQLGIGCACCPIGNGFSCRRVSAFIRSPTETRIRCC